MAAWRDAMPPRVRCFRRKRRHDSLRRRSCRCSGLPGRSCGVDCLRGRARWLNNLRGRNRRCDALRGRGRRHRRNNRYWLSAVHAEPCIPRKFRAAFRAIHACRPSLGFHFFSRPYCKPDTTGNRTKQHQARVPTRFFLPAFIPLFRATAFDYSFTIEITPKETGNHVLQPLWSRKQERGSVLSKLRKRIERKLTSRRRPLGI